MGDRQVTAVSDACETYLTTKGTWTTAGRAFTKAKDSVESEMEKAKLERYEYDGRVFRFNTNKKLVVEKAEKET
jgi:hypothetical protein